MRRKGSVSSKDVAKEAGVSQATVSYILNNVKDVKIKPETRQAVLDAIKKLNYHPNQIARGMRLKKSMSVGVVTDRSVTNFYFMKTLEGIRDGLQQDNYSITMLFDKYESIEDAEFIKYYNSNRIDGIIFAFASIEDSEIDYMNNLGIPYVVVDTFSSGRNIHEVCTDHLSHIQDVIAYFKEKNVQRVAYTGPLPRCKPDRRIDAFKEALALHGYDLHEDLIIRSSADNDEICRLISVLFTDPAKKPDAILAGSPKFGMLTVKTCHMLNVKIPENVRIVAVGSSNFFNLLHPQLSSIEIPLYDMGFNAAQKLLKIINNNGEDEEKSLILPSEVIMRQSL